MFNNRIIYFLLFLLLSAFGCKEDPPVVPTPPPRPVYRDTISVAVEDVTHRSITVNIKTTVNNPKSTIKFFRIYNSTETQVTDYPITVSDTSIIDDGLQLNTTYTYYAVRIDTTGERKDSSNVVMAKTYDTTSHNYSWQEFRIGEWQSVLYDVWGTDENNVYACGSVKINDTVYGIIKWNGNQWLPEKKIGGLQAIIGFSNSDIWTAGGGVWHFNGAEWEEYTYRDPVITNNISYSSIWGTSSNNLYFGNIGGKIINWDGSKAEIMAHPTNFPLTDMYGLSSNFILATGSTLTTPSIGLLYNGITWVTLPGLNYNNILLRTVLAVNANQFFICGSRSYEYINNQPTEILTQAPGIIEKIRRNKETGEIVAVGDGFTLLHFNGHDWKDYSYELNQPNSAFYGVYITPNKIFAVGSGTNANNATIFIGTKN
ncbi:MAG: hypothetical protein IH618_01490 [Ignavibacteriaceae bacterium]|nr:hypothetical protein [Ignavibacteriaceae bacterium]